MAEVKITLTKDEVQEFDEILEYIKTLSEDKKAKIYGFLQGVKCMA